MGEDIEPEHRLSNKAPSPEKILGKWISVCGVLLLAFAALADETDYAIARAGMVDEVQFYATLARDTGEDTFDDDVLRSLGTVRRHEFVPDRQKRYAYENRPLPIGHGQTISQPYIVALMTELIEPGFTRLRLSRPCMMRRLHASIASVTITSRRNSATVTTVGKNMRLSMQSS
jgi:hypothetical protein